MASENVKNHPKTFNQLKTKNFPEFISIFRFFQGNKTLNLNSPNYMEPFDTKVDCFGGRNCYQQKFSIYARIQ
jgi:hypothetical protein